MAKERERVGKKWKGRIRLSSLLLENLRDPGKMEGHDVTEKISFVCIMYIQCVKLKQD